MKNIKGTETEKNVLKAFAGESQARNRYTFFASQAGKEGFKQIQNLFLESAENEKEHAKTFFKFLSGGQVEITAMYPAGVIGSTEENLEAAASGENEEYTELYPSFAEVAEKEGFTEIARTFKKIAEVEKEHEKRYLRLLENIREGKIFKRDKEVRWKCSNCGYVHTGKEAPAVCPSCLHKQEYFEIKEANY